MTTSAGSVSIGVRPDTAGFGTKLHDGVMQESSGLGTLGKVLGGAVLGGVGVALAGVGAILHTGLGEVMDASAGTAQLAAGIKSTGNAAAVSVDGLNALASSIQGYSGQTDDSIVASEQLLLTFTNIKNSGPDKIFDLATVATADMAAKMGGDAAGMAVKLGKALNDPINGVTALSRVGVQFTDGQKASIKAMQDSGNMAGAQKIILSELTTEFGGAAKAAGQSLPGQLNIAKRSFEDMSQSVVGGLMPAIVPALTKVAGVVTDKIMPAVSGFVTGMTEGTGAGGVFAGILSGLWNNVLVPLGRFVTDTVVPGIKALVAAFKAGGSDVTSGGFAGVMERIGLVARVVADVFTKTVVPAAKTLADFFMQKIVPAVTGIVDAIRGFLTVAVPIVQQFVAGMMERITPLLPKIKAIFTNIGAAITEALNAIKVIIQTVTSVISFIWSHFGQAIMDFIVDTFKGIMKVVDGAINVIRGIIQVVTSLIQGDWSGVWNGIQKIFSGVWEMITGIVDQALAKIKLVLTVAWDLITMAVSAVWNGIKDFFGSIWDGIKALFQAALTFVKDMVQREIDGWKLIITTVWNAVKQVFTDVWDGIKAAFQAALTFVKEMVQREVDGWKLIFSTVWDAIKLGVQTAWDLIKGVFTTVLTAVQTAFSTAVTAIGTVWNGLQDLAKVPIRFVVNTVFAGIANAFNKVAGLVGLSIPVPNVSFAQGGAVTGGTPGKDSIAALLMPNEFVVRSDGSNLADAFAHFGVPGFADGGVVGSLLSPVKSFIDGILDKIPGTGQLIEFAKAVPGKIFDAMISKVTSLIPSWLGGGSGGDGGAGGAGGAARWADVVLQALAIVGQPISNLALTLRRMNQESGGNPRAINLTDCLPTDHQILTQRGWLKHDEVNVGDLTIGYNATTRVSEWTRVSRVVHFADAPLVRLHNSRWDVTTTPNHRWINVPRVSVPTPTLPDDCPLCDWPADPLPAALTVCPECGWLPTAPRGVALHRARKHGVQGANAAGRRAHRLRRRGRTTHRGIQIHLARVHGISGTPQVSAYATEPSWITTQDINTRSRLLLSAPAATPSHLDVSVQEAAILGWIAGDGHVETRRFGPSMSIAQSKPVMVDKIQALLATVPHADYVDEQLTRTGKKAIGPRHQFRLDFRYAQDLLRRAGHPKRDAVRQVLAMSTQQRAAWLDAMIDAEGHREPPRTSGNKETVGICQTYGPVLEAITIATYLAGHRPRVLDHKVDQVLNPTWSPTASVYLNGPIVTGSSLVKENAGRGDVWCVTTDLGSWTARDQTHVFLTGNSNAKAGIPSKGLMQTIDPTFNAYRDRSLSSDVYDPLANIVASMYYALARYGSLAAAYNKSGGYALGTPSAAAGYAWVGEAGPELVQFRGGETVIPNNQISKATGNGDADLLAEVRGLRSDIRALPRDYQFGQRAMVGSGGLR